MSERPGDGGGNAGGPSNRSGATRSKKPIGRLRNLISLALFGIAAVLFIVVGVMYFRDKENGDTPPTPASVPGQAQLKNVVDALSAQDLKVEYLRGMQAGLRVDDVSEPGQGLTVDGTKLYVFIFDSPAARESGSTGLTTDALTDAAKGFNNTPIAEGTPHGVGGSNVYAVLFGGSSDVAAKVDRAIQGIP